MKKIWIFIAIFFVSIPLMGQGKNQLNEMIITSLNAYIEHIHDWMDKGIIVKEQTCHHYVCKDGFPRYFPFDSVQNITFFSVDFFSIYSNPFKRKLKKGIGALFVSFELADNQLRIAVSSRSVKLTNKKNISVGLSDWGHYFYEYSCENQQWILIETKYGGI